MKKPSERQLRVIAHVKSGMSWFAAGQAEKYSDTFSRVIRFRFMQNPALCAELEAIEQAVRERAVYGAEQLIIEVDREIAHARQNKNNMAVMKGIEIKARVSGLWVERIQEIPFDLKGNIEAAKLRVFQAIQNEENRAMNIKQLGDGTEQRGRKDESGNQS